MARRPSSLAGIRLLVLDVDGVLTDGGLRYGAGGEVEKVFHVRDGTGIKAVQAAGVTVAVISGRRAEATERRCQELGIREVHQGVEEKLPVLRQLLERHGLAASQCACVGDDLPDVPLFALAGIAIAVADAHPTAKAAAHRRTRLAGGTGAVREVCDWLLAARTAAARGARRVPTRSPRSRR
jgi:3-deoxy-D-manno-octulosonate 8-phosphate phosphatase (KDO 8-P phosphatase)